MTSTQPVLVADCVAKSFRDRRVLNSASLRAMPGEVRALLGRNGAGKSTLLKIAVGLVQPDSGSVFVDGEALERATLPALARRGVMYLPDDGVFSSAFTLGRQLAFFAHQFPGGDVTCAAQLARVSHLLDRRVPTLSGGERRRAELAAALVRRPRCLVADEPFRSIAPLDAELLSEAYRALTADGCAVVVTGHETPTLFAAADHVTWCTDGTTYELGAPESAQNHERFCSEFLGPRWWRASG